jgi:hypothetical protein
MNLLVDDINEVVKARIPIEFNTNFRNSILFELLMQDNNLNEEIKINQAINLYYPDRSQIKDVKKAIDDILWFYKCGKETKTSQKEQKKVKEKQIYSYEFDDDLIYDAFLDQYNINLQTINYLHWWEFKARFNGLKEDNLIVKIMGYRGIDLSKIKDKEEKKHYKMLQKQYALPDMRTEEQKEADFGKVFW